MIEKKKVCEMLNGKWNDKLEGCELLLKDIKIKDDYLYVTFNGSDIITHSYDRETGLPNYLTVELFTPKINELKLKLTKTAKPSIRRTEMAEELKYYTQFDDLITRR